MLITRTISQLMFPVVLLFGIYIGLHGHLTPGGSFPAGVIIASAFLMLYLPREHASAIHTTHRAKKIEAYALALLLLTLLFTLFHIKVPLTELVGTQGTLISAIGVLLPNLAGTAKVGSAIILILVAFLFIDRKGEKP